MDPEYQGVLEEIAGRLGPGVEKPFPDANLLHGFLFRPEPGRWRLYLAADSADYIEGPDGDVGAMRPFLTLNGDVLVWIKVGASLVRFQNGGLTPAGARAETTSWHLPRS